MCNPNTGSTTAVPELVQGIRQSWINYAGSCWAFAIWFPTPKVSVSALRPTTSETEATGLGRSGSGPVTWVAFPSAGPIAPPQAQGASRLIMPNSQKRCWYFRVSHRLSSNHRIIQEMWSRVHAGPGGWDGKRRLERRVTLLYHFQGSSLWQSLLFMIHFWWRVEAACFQHIFKGRAVPIIDPSTDRNVSSVLLIQ